jgi:hypothetical protein
MISQELQNDASFYWSVCILRYLRDKGLLTQAEYERICAISKKQYGSKLICV